MDDPPRQSPTRRILMGSALLAAFAPALIPLILILKYGVDFPYWDEWDPGIAGLYIKAHAHQLTFADLVKQHNEHRIFIPRVIFLVLNSITHWSAKWEMIVQWLIVCVTSLLVLALCRRTESTDGFVPVFRRAPVRWRTLFLWFVANLLIFSPAAFENWMWGIGLVNVLPMMFIAAALLVVTSDWRPWRRTTIAILIAAASLYSSGNGILCWPLAGLLVIWPLTRQTLRDRKWQLLAWASAFVLLTALYFVHYVKPDHRGKAPYAQGVLPVLGYIPIFLGVPFAFIGNYTPTVTASTLGGIELALYLAAIVCFLLLWRWRDDAPTAGRILVWLAVGGYALLSAIMAAMARAGTSVEQALMSPRYVSYAVYFPIALLMIVPILAERVRRILPRRSVVQIPLLQIPAALVAVLILLQLFTYPSAVRNCRMIQLMRHEGKAALLLIEALPDRSQVSTLVFPDADVTLTQARALNQLGYIKPPLIQSRNAAQIEETDASRLKGAQGRLEQVGQVSPGQGGATGWAIFSQTHSPADAVFLTYDDEHRDPIIFALADVGGQRDDIAAQQHSSGYANCGWIARFPVSNLPTYMRSTTIRAWAFDTESGRATRLEGSATVQP